MNDEDLRDLFAGLALQGMVARHNPHDLVMCATHAYKIADAMIEAKYCKEEPEVGITAIKKRKTKEQL
jgi:hypothetical protein